MVRTLAACGLHARRHHAERLRLRPVHRRPGRALRRRGAGRHRHPDLRRQHRPADHGDEGFRRHRHLLHAQLLPAPDRTRRRRWASTSASCRCARASSAPSRGPSPCAAASRAEAGIKAYDIYGLSEIIGPGVGIECHCQNGLHIFEDHFYPEIIDPETRRAAARRRGGRTGAHHAQQAGHADDPLPHARHHGASSPSRAPAGARMRRIRRIGRRSDDMFIIRGVNVFPVADRGGAAGRRRHAAALPDHPDAREGPGPDGGAGGGHARGVQRQRRRDGGPASSKLVQRHSISILQACAWQITPGRAAHHPAQRRQGQASHRSSGQS